MLSTVNTVFWGLNKVICIELLKTIDIGGSVIIHMFGAFFGLIASCFLYSKRAAKDPKKNGNYFSQAIAIAGTLFLFMFWPSFNAVTA
jgi:ammonium transporter Rh